MKKRQFAVLLCGCGAGDGSEIHEATMTLLAIDKLGAEYTVFAPDDNQRSVVNHVTGKEMNETRNMMVEAARIARGQIKPITEYSASDFDALVLPGGFGAAKNLCDYAFAGANAVVREDVSKIIRETFAQGKPIGGLCIAPVILAKVLGNVSVTLGTDAVAISNVEHFGATHINTQEREVAIDKKNKIFSTPCYMLAASIADIATSAENLIKAMIENI